MHGSPTSPAIGERGCPERRRSRPRIEWLPRTQTLAEWPSRRAARRSRPIEHAHERQAREGGVERRYEPASCAPGATRIAATLSRRRARLVDEDDRHRGSGPPRRAALHHNSLLTRSGPVADFAPAQRSALLERGQVRPRVEQRRPRKIRDRAAAPSLAPRPRHRASHRPDGLTGLAVTRAAEAAL